MLESSDRPIPEVVAFFSQRGLESGFLVPTQTGLKKSIMDAHASLRAYVLDKNFHDYDRQGQGETHKVVRDAWLVGKDDLIKTTVSLYRPETKLGDPRIWIYKLGGYAQAGNLLALLVDRDELYIINTSNAAIWKSAEKPESPFSDLLIRLTYKGEAIANELLDKLRVVGRKGFIYTKRPGPTGVGMTLETELGIAANSSRSPDYRGIEIKATRIGRSGKAKSRTTLFSQVPDWKRSAFKGGVELVREFGYVRGEQHKLNCTLCCKPNPQGLFLVIENIDDILHAKHTGTKGVRNVVQWAMPHLRDVLRKKHKETIWVKAETNGSGKDERFRYISASHTAAPLVNNFGTLIETGFIETDFAVKIIEKPGRSIADDHGYLFKIDQRHINLLFPPGKNYVLV